MRAVQRLDEETRTLRADLEAEDLAMLQSSTPAEYERYLTRAYSFIAPLERSLLDTGGLAPYLDSRRHRKSSLIEHDLRILGLKPLEVQSIPQCMWIPWFEDPWTALGWAYLIERNTLSFQIVFNHLASVLPGEAAFAASYLKVYAGTAGETWNNFVNGIERAAHDPSNLETMVAGALAAHRNFRRWRNVLDGKALSSPPRDHADEPGIADDPDDSASVSEES